MLKLEARPQPSDFWRIASPLLALVLTVVLVGSSQSRLAALGDGPRMDVKLGLPPPTRSTHPRNIRPLLAGGIPFPPPRKLEPIAPEALPQPSRARKIGRAHV